MDAQGQRTNSISKRATAWRPIFLKNIRNNCNKYYYVHLLRFSNSLSYYLFYFNVSFFLFLFYFPPIFFFENMPTQHLCFPSSTFSFKTGRFLLWSPYRQATSRGKAQTFFVKTAQGCSERYCGHSANCPCKFNIERRRGDCPCLSR